MGGGEKESCMAMITLNFLSSTGATRLCSTLLTCVWRQTSVSAIHTDFLQRQRVCLDKTVLFDSLGLCKIDTFVYIQCERATSLNGHRMVFI